MIEQLRADGQSGGVVPCRNLLTSLNIDSQRNSSFLARLKWSGLWGILMPIEYVLPPDMALNACSCNVGLIHPQTERINAHFSFMILPGVFWVAMHFWQAVYFKLIGRNNLQKFQDFGITFQISFPNTPAANFDETLN